MNQRMAVIAAIVTAAALTGILSTAPIVVYADESDTSTDQSLAQKNVGSGDSANFNCAQNLIKAGVGQQQCGNDGGEIIIGLPEVLVPTTEVLLPLPFP
jgi:hypothetical protein